MDFKECKHCKSRYIGCHSHCSSYIAVKKQLNIIRENKIKAAKIENYFSGRKI